MYDEMSVIQSLHNAYDGQYSIKTKYMQLIPHLPFLGIVFSGVPNLGLNVLGVDRFECSCEVRLIRLTETEWM